MDETVNRGRNLHRSHKSVTSFRGFRGVGSWVLVRIWCCDNGRRDRVVYCVCEPHERAVAYVHSAPGENTARIEYSTLHE